MFEIEPKDFLPHIGFYTKKRVEYPVLNEPVKWLQERGLTAFSQFSTARGLVEKDICPASDEYFLGFFRDGAIIPYFESRTIDRRRHIVVIADHLIAFEFRMRWC